MKRLLAVLFLALGGTSFAGCLPDAVGKPSTLKLLSEDFTASFASTVNPVCRKAPVSGEPAQTSEAPAVVSRIELPKVAAKAQKASTSPPAGSSTGADTLSLPLEDVAKERDRLVAQCLTEFIPAELAEGKLKVCIPPAVGTNHVGQDHREEDAPKNEADARRICENYAADVLKKSAEESLPLLGFDGGYSLIEDPEAGHDHQSDGGSATAGTHADEESPSAEQSNRARSKKKAEEPYRSCGNDPDFFQRLTKEGKLLPFSYYKLKIKKDSNGWEAAGPDDAFDCVGVMTDANGKVRGKVVLTGLMPDGQGSVDFRSQFLGRQLPNPNGEFNLNRHYHPVWLPTGHKFLIAGCGEEAELRQNIVQFIQTNPKDPTVTVTGLKFVGSPSDPKNELRFQELGPLSLQEIVSPKYLRQNTLDLVSYAKDPEK
jgi:hypothetical protein